ncbi:MAG: hypothetical protein HYS18_13075 [Burkholderiales bacterium]|nr:hypothetical protein [Burkholderiales bacterium]
MLKLFSSSSFFLGIAPDGAALLRAESGRAASTVLAEYQAESAQSLPALLDGLRTKLANAGVMRMPVTIILADQWTRMFMVTPPQNASSLDDCRAAAMRRFQDLYGESPNGWQMHADWDAQHPFLACAMPDSVLSSLKQLAAEFRWTLLTVVPQFIAAWNRWHKELDGNAWFGVALGNRLNLGVIEHGRLRAVNAIQVADGAWKDAQWLPAQMEREALRLSLASPQQMRVCGLLNGAPAGRAEITPTCQRLDAAQIDTTGTAAMALARTGIRA